ncbi:MAG: hypothetical protein ABIP62_08155 [Vicinamibacteria bacterium]
MARSEIWVMASGGRWLVAQKGRAGNIGYFDSMEEAALCGRRAARYLQCDLMVRTAGEWKREVFAPGGSEQIGPRTDGEK